MNIEFKARFLACLLALLSFPATAIAGGGPENVLLVVNANSDSSKMIANWYIAGRGIPARNVVYLDSVPERERVTQQVFSKNILEPVLNAITERQLDRSIDYIVYSSDFPTAISIANHFHKLKALDENLPMKFFLAEASISSMTYFAFAVQNDSPGYMAFSANYYFRQPASVILRAPFVGQHKTDFQNALKGFNKLSGDQLQKSINALTEMAKKNPQQIALAYWLARLNAKKGDFKLAAKWLQHSIKLGWHFRQKTLSDPMFESALKDPLFKGFANRIPNKPFDFAPSRGFKRGYAFGPNGFKNNEPGQGNQHFLSTVLAVTRNFGNTEQEALRQLKTSMAADESRPKGTFYFTDNDGPRTRPRKPGFAASIAALEAMGHKAKIIKTDLPVNARDVIGLTCGQIAFDFGKSGSKIAPGAICENLTSWGGVMARDGGHSGISEFVRHGAAGSSGTVIEPYNIQAKFPHPMIHAHYARGSSLAEAFYQSVQGPFQLLIVGDALCQPWATKPKFTVQGLKPGDKVSGKRELKLDISKSPVPVQAMELYIDGRVLARTMNKDTINFDTSAMTDGFHEARFVLIAGGLIETVGNVVIPFVVDNFGKQTTLTAERSSYRSTSKITFDAKTNFGNAIELFHNSRSLGKKDGQAAQFTVSASDLGRGPVELTAVALSDKGNKVTTVPLKLNILGRLSKTKVLTEPPPKTKPKPKPAPAK